MAELSHTHSSVHQSAHVERDSRDPGEVFGVVGFALAFVGAQILGLIFSIIAYRRSQAADFKNNLALAGIILNSAFIAITIVLVFVFILLAVQSGSSDFGPSYHSLYVR